MLACVCIYSRAGWKIITVTDSVDIYLHIYQPDGHKELCAPCALVYIVVCSLTAWWQHLTVCHAVLASVKV